MPTPVGYGRPGVFVTENFAPLSNNAGAIPGEALPAFAALYNRGPVAPTLVTSWQQFTNLYGTFSTQPGSLLPFAVNQFFGNGGTQCFIARVPNTDATASALTLQDVGTPSAANILTVNAASPGAWGNQVYVEVVSAGQSGRVNINVYFSGTAASNLVETFQDLSMNPVDVRNAVTIINSPIAGSNYILVTETLPGGIYTMGTTDLALVTPTPLTGGSDGSTSPALDDLTHGAPPVFDQLINQALYVNFPGLNNITTLTNLNAWAEGRGDVMLIIDGPAPPSQSEKESDVAQNYINMTSGVNSLPQSTYLTVYAPWIQVTDPSSTVIGATRWLPPGGAVLGVWQRTDVQFGTVQSPAGIQATIGAIQLEANFSNKSLDNLNNNYVNAIKFIPTIGIVIFGSRTLHPGYPDRYVAVRRMIIKLEHDLKWITQYALFQPNDARLWASITTTISVYLTQLMQAHQLGGTTPDNSFQVICNSTNNAQPLSAKVLTVNGWKLMGEIETGDRVIDPYGQESKVTGVYPKGIRPVYEVVLADGSVTAACNEHIWEVETIGHNTKMLVNTEQLKDLVEGRKVLCQRGSRAMRTGASLGVRVPQMKPFGYEAIPELPLDPYLLGVLISEGSVSSGNSVSFAQVTANTEVIERVRQALPAGHYLRTFGPHMAEHRIVTGAHGGPGRNKVLNTLRDLGIYGKRSWEKFIPDIYKYASVEDRLALLQGIMDGDGHANRRQHSVSHTTSSKRLHEDVRELILSLGGRTTASVIEGVTYTSPAQHTPKEARDAYRIDTVQMELNPFYLPWKAARFKPQNAAYHRKVISVRYLRDEAVQCIRVSADSHLYVTDDGIPTHNTLATAAAGIVNASVAVSLLSPAEFIYITLSQFQGSQAQQTTVSTSSTAA